MKLDFNRNLHKIQDSGHLSLMNLPNTVTLNALGPEIIVAVRHSNKAKHLAIKISHKGAELVIPKNCLGNHLKKGYKFLQEKECWIRQKLRKMSAKQHTTGTIDHLSLPFFGKIYALQYIENSCSTLACQIKEDQNVIEVISPPLKHHNTLIQFLRSSLLSNITILMNTLKQKHNFRHSDIKIIDSKRRWGSCSNKGVIAFNWRLVFVPPEILKYVAIHELCHTIEMNHSPRFWNLVAKLYPDYKRARLWLKENGSRLHQYLPL
jgi:predicted metal-dependent hydrolase